MPHQMLKITKFWVVSLPNRVKVGMFPPYMNWNLSVSETTLFFLFITCVLLTCFFKNFIFRSALCVLIPISYTIYIHVTAQLDEMNRILHLVQINGMYSVQSSLLFNNRVIKLFSLLYYLKLSGHDDRTYFIQKIFY